MTAINFSAKGAAATAEKIGILTEGMVGVPVSFSFDSAWDGLNIIAVFRCGGVTKDRVLIGTNQTTVPWEVLKRQGELEIGAEGRSADGSVVIPTVWAKVGRILPGANAAADPGLEPSPTAYDEIMSAMGNLNTLQTKDKQSLVAAINELVEAGASLQANINEGGHLILTLPNGNIIDAGYAVGPPGADGDDGITPHIGDNGNWWLGEVDTGISAHGYTPVKGEDYWTEADKQEIVEGVIADVGVDDSKVGNKPWSSKNTVDELAIRSEASGDAISVSDASNLPLQGLTLYGKTTQDGTPTPDAPVALESVGDGGSVGVKVLGKNLLPFKYKNKSTTINGVTATVNDDGSITWSGTATGYLGFPLCSNAPISDFPTVFTVLALGTYKNVTIQVAILDDSTYLYNSDMQSKSQTINLANYPTAKTINIIVKRRNDGLETSGTIYPMVVAGAVTSAEYEPYKEPQTLTASTPNGLHGIPVSSGGNYTDESGRQWVCDEMDFEPGVYIQNVDEFILKGTESWTFNSSAKNPYFYIRFTPENPIKLYARGLCSHFPYASSPNAQPAGSIVFGWNSTYTNLLFASGHSSVDEWKAYLAEQNAAGTPVTVQYCLATPIETALTAEELAQYAVLLHTYKPNTTAFNDSGASMKLKYIADTKTYIDNKFAELAAAIVANA